jgi:hypothetical protein
MPSPTNKAAESVLDTTLIVNNFLESLNGILAPVAANPAHEWDKLNEAVRKREIIDVVKNSDGSMVSNKQDLQFIQDQHLNFLSSTEVAARKSSPVKDEGTSFTYGEPVRTMIEINRYLGDDNRRSEKEKIALASAYFTAANETMGRHPDTNEILTMSEIREKNINIHPKIIKIIDALTVIIADALRDKAGITFGENSAKAKPEMLAALRNLQGQAQQLGEQATKAVDFIEKLDVQMAKVNKLKNYLLEKDPTGKRNINNLKPQDAEKVQSLIAISGAMKDYRHTLDLKQLSSTISPISAGDEGRKKGFMGAHKFSNLLADVNDLIKSAVSPGQAATLSSSKSPAPQAFFHEAPVKTSGKPAVVQQENISAVSRIKSGK